MSALGMQPAADCHRALVAWRRVGADAASGTWRFPASLAVFSGHFPGAPLLPGVYALAAADALLVLACPGWRLGAVERAKWLAPVAPDQELEIAVRWRGAPPASADATVRLAGVVAATARLRALPAA
jgi:3-hydroxymyristoyl/3-hydroxydecanoyl-(acyl carrier protein) dehydratase